MSPDRTVTLAEFLVGRVGLMKATKVAAFVVAWGIYIEAEDLPPWTLDGYAAYWKQGISTTYRERDLFRICWPEEKDPTDVWYQIRALYDSKVEAKRRELVTARVLSLSWFWGS